MTAERRKRMIEVLQHRQQNITVVLENVHDPHNIFAVMRTCDAVGIQDIYVINSKLPEHKKAGKASGRSAKKWLSINHFDQVDSCVTELRKHYSKILSSGFSTESLNMFDVDFTESIALVFGNEQKGVSEELSALADGNFIIPQTGMIKSLNISVACAVTMYEAFRQKNLAGHYLKPSFSYEKQEALLNDWSLNDSKKNA